MAPRSDTLSDAELITLVLGGAQAHFRTLMERHQDAVYRYLHRFLFGDADTAQDLTQEVFLKAYQGLASVDRERPFQPWLYRIAHNEAVNHLRSRSRRPEAGMELEDWARVPDPEAQSPETELAVLSEQQAVQQALQALKPNQREAVQLFYFEEQSYEEIARIMGISLGTVGTLIHRGRNRLRELLGEPPD